MCRICVRAAGCRVMTRAYLMLVAPAINIGLSGLDSKGPAGWAARWAIMQMVNSYTAWGYAADLVAGTAEK